MQLPTHSQLVLLAMPQRSEVCTWGSTNDKGPSEGTHPSGEAAGGKAGYTRTPQMA